MRKKRYFNIPLPGAFPILDILGARYKDNLTSQGTWLLLLVLWTSREQADNGKVAWSQFTSPSSTHPA